ncbi:hypothetical protein LAZ67_2002544 [Cordylochernes scorpioides]|uniref:Reverse transcriptase domain-containing protein n=1 Tax=Cordylochernes scorpioides TaxID=51811 RepID=A0ABY6K263_9ARAC|nr:hypothetical protein LAZ67_2002544 [Cordylochernes scorpioides]
MNRNDEEEVRPGSRISEADEHYMDTLTMPPPPLDDLVERLTIAIRGLTTPQSTELNVPPFDGTYSAQEFINQFDDSADRLQMSTEARRLRVPGFLIGEPLHFYRQLGLAAHSYHHTCQVLMDLYPGGNEATFAKFTGLRLTSLTTLQEYYKTKVAMGIQLGLPMHIILEALTEGLSLNDQRLIRAVSPQSLSDWYTTMTRVKGASVYPAAQDQQHDRDNNTTAPKTPFQGKEPQQHPPRNTPLLSSRGGNTTRLPPSPCYHCGGDHWNSECSKAARRSYRPRAYSARGEPPRSLSPAPTTTMESNLYNHKIYQSNAPLSKAWYYFSYVSPCNKGVDTPNINKVGQTKTTFKQPTFLLQGSQDLTKNMSPPTLPCPPPISPCPSSISTCLQTTPPCLRPPAHCLQTTSPCLPPFLSSSSNNSETITNSDIDVPNHHTPCATNLYNFSSPYPTNDHTCKIFNNDCLHCLRPDTPLDFVRLINRFTHIFSLNKYDIPKLDIPPVNIRTLSNKIITLRPYRTSITDQHEIQEQIKQMLKYKIIEPSYSPFSAPVTLVRKKDNTRRFCVDFRKLNEIINPDVHPLPIIEAIFDKLAHATIFSTADIASAYWQVEIAPQDRNLLSFVTLEGQYHFTRLPFGLKTSPPII